MLEPEYSTGVDHIPADNCTPIPFSGIWMPNSKTLQRLWAQKAKGRTFWSFGLEAGELLN
jgi:hypothetical protein